MSLIDHIISSTIVPMACNDAYLVTDIII